MLKTRRALKDEDQNEIKESKVIPDVVIGETDPNSRPTSGKKTEDNNEVKDSELPQAIGEVLNEKKKSKLNSSSCELKETDLGHIRDIFAMFDNEKSGTIMASQVGEMIRSVGLCPTDEEIEEITKAILEKNGCSFITLFDILNCSAVQEYNIRSQACEFQKAFETFDTDRDGHLTCEEMLTLLTEVGNMRLTVEEAQDLVAMVDTEQTDKLDYMQFVRLFTQ